MARHSGVSSALWHILDACRIALLTSFGKILLGGTGLDMHTTKYIIHLESKTFKWIMRVVLKASNVAAMIGRHRYKPRTEVLDELWKKYAPTKFSGKTKEDKAEEALKVSIDARVIVESALKVETKDSSQVQKVFNVARDAINFDPKLNNEQKAEVIEHIRSKVYTSHGTRSEDKTSDKVEADEGARLVRDDSFYQFEVCKLGDNKYVVMGKIDRIEERPDGSRVLVEIKNRTNRLFRSVPEYEFIQVQVYLQMLGLVHARVVEQYNNQVLSHDVTRDEEMWVNEILPGLQEFCKELDEKLT